MVVVGHVPGHVLPVLAVGLTVEFAEHGVVEVIEHVAHKEATNFLEGVPDVGCLIECHLVFGHLEHAVGAVITGVPLADGRWCASIDAD